MGRGSHSNHHKRALYKNNWSKRSSVLGPREKLVQNEIISEKCFQTFLLPILREWLHSFHIRKWHKHWVIMDLWFWTLWSFPKQETKDGLYRWHLGSVGKQWTMRADRAVNDKTPLAMMGSLVLSALSAGWCLEQTWVWMDTIEDHTDAHIHHPLVGSDPTQTSNQSFYGLEQSDKLPICTAGGGTNENRHLFP